MRLANYKSNPSGWQRWFAWYPVVASLDHDVEVCMGMIYKDARPAEWRWLEYVERHPRDSSDGPYYIYRVI